jgi:RNA exonuclease 4
MTVQADVALLLEGRILVGHAVRNDLDALKLAHPRRDTRDTAGYRGFRKISAGRTPGLKRLAKEVLGMDIQGGEHSSVCVLNFSLQELCPSKEDSLFLTADF